MKILFALIFLLLLNNSWGQIDTLKYYHWEDLYAENATAFDPDTILALSFRKMKLSELPEELTQFKHLISLNLEKNKLSKLPDFIADFKQLEIIHLTSNKFTIFPIQFCRMSQLKQVYLSQNEIAVIPDCIEYIRSLEYIDLYDNPIRALPESITRLKHLKELDLSGIRFSPDFQASWKERLPNVKIVFDAPCDCMK